MKTDKTISSSLSNSSTDSPKPKRPQHEKKNQKSSPKRTQNGKGTPKKSRRSTKSHKKASKPAVVEIEELSEEEKENYVAIDCEMVGVGATGFESALARVSIVNWHNDVLLDTYVKVDQPVTDYRTFVSGISPAHIESDDALSLHECRTLVSSVIEGKVVVGHALKNDFDVLRLSHPWYLIRDTAKFEPFMKTADKSIKTYDPNNLVPKKLKDLAKDKLGMQIQQDGKSHDSIEDSIAAIELYKKARRKWEKAIQWKLNKTRDIEESHVKMGNSIHFSGISMDQSYCEYHYEISSGVTTVLAN
eukprot:CAMPEP_0197842214 /NCGR_PEP_ID=MMETSP1437-20131217/46614_1 /TAXON_ID=49252 ORGANISM="Eucampia antarctica, Strain CCMP1452" /NCGR_SAMPLE_ID=MMETSP1437 /ASSEMBLY_ACC=CAM_ASM_001096 /LENGTH=302 /DNA_ID=CAMNT_0043452067 /DNA_START=488 /DNA_END=1396 /DNA_ORIENTATION=+